MIIELIRHGETELQARKCYQGAIDVPLSAEGRKKLEAGRAGRREPAPDHVYVSPLGRARQTASILFPQSRQIIIPELAEMHFGSFEGKNYLDMENDPEYRAWVDGMCLGRCPGGESRQEFSDRTCRAFLRLLRMEAGAGHAASLSATHAASVRADEGADLHMLRKETMQPIQPDLVIVAHGGTMMALLDRFAMAGEPLHNKRKENPQSRPDYYSWQLPCGHSYLLEVRPADDSPADGSPVDGSPEKIIPEEELFKRAMSGEGHPEENRPAELPLLRILGTRNYTGALQQYDPATVTILSQLPQKICYN